jgi:hypothetical protein
MVYVELNGRFGNYLFQIATAASLAYKNDSKFAVVCHEKYLLPDNSTIYEYIQQFNNSIFKNIKVLKSIPNDCTFFMEKDALYNPIKYTDNIYLHGTFQSEKYFDQNIVRSLFQIPMELKSSLLQKYGHVISKDVTSIHVRRGDYLKRPHEYNVTSMNYFKKAIRRIGKDTPFLIISDDIQWCKQHFMGANFFFADNNSALEDLYLQSLCKNNIISNSSFSWWGAWLNQNPNKVVISPKPWYGKSLSYIRTDDLIPPGWIQLENRMLLKMRIKAHNFRLKNKLLPLIYSIKDRLLHEVGAAHN